MNRIINSEVRGFSSLPRIVLFSQIFNLFDEIHAKMWNINVLQNKVLSKVIDWPVGLICRGFLRFLPDFFTSSYNRLISQISSTIFCTTLQNRKQKCQVRALVGVCVRVGGLILCNSLRLSSRSPLHRRNRWTGSEKKKPRQQTDLNWIWKLARI